MKYPIIQTVEDFYNELIKDKNHRYMSWEHCFNAFQQPKQLYFNSYIDNLSLHLAFYLASWGMMRGSTGLLWKDYKIHYKTIEIIIKNKYDAIRYSENKKIGEKEIKLILEVKNEISDYYKEVSYTKPTKTGYKLQHQTITPTDTLITKILLGTLGCIPAYDRFFLSGLKEKQIQQQSQKGSYINSDSLIKLYNFVNKNDIYFLKVQDIIKNKSGAYYPIMKIADMYFWEIGRVVLNNNNNKKNLPHPK